MSEKFEGGIPPQERGEIKAEAPDVSNHISFIKEAAWQYRGLDQSEIKQSFGESFEKLPETEKKAISLELQALNIEIGALDNQNEGIAIVRQSEIANRIREVMDRSGVVASAKEGGIDRTKEQVAEVAIKTAAYLTEYETFAQSVRDKSKDTRENAGYLLAISLGIKQELERLQLADVASAQSQNELQNEREARQVIDTSVSQFGRRLDNTIEMEGLIGFSTLNKLIKEFHSAKKYLEESVLEPAPEK